MGRSPQVAGPERPGKVKIAFGVTCAYFPDTLFGSIFSLNPA
jgi:hypothetical protein